jgi:uncharacterized protein (TIGR02452 family)
MGRTENAEIFRDTERLCRTNEKLKNSVLKSTENQKLILESDKLEKPELKLYENAAKVTVSKKRSFEAAKAYAGQRVAVHNFASASNPGGGVVNGSSAQEECLCRCSGLYFNLDTPAMWNGFYTPHRATHDPIHNDDIIYTPGVIVFKSDDATPVLMPEESWYEVDVITCAAPNLREKPSNSYNAGDGANPVKVTDEKLGKIHEKRLRRILDAAVLEGDDTVILGAFGCGAFRNNPKVVAQAARNVIEEYLYAFKNIEFAVYCSSRDESNFEIFDRMMKELE